MNNKFDFIEKELAARSRENRLRHLRSVTPLSGVSLELEGREVLNFSSNDYLGLSKHKDLREKAIEYTQKFGSGATASRLVCGNFSICEQLEEKIASLKGTESSLIFNSGYQANISIIPVLSDRKTLILADRLAHSSLIQGALLAKCKLQRFHHNDMEHLEKCLLAAQKQSYSRILILTESVFSMDGDCAPLDQIIELSQQYQAILCVDEAHATGVLGEEGRGYCYGKKVDFVIGTFGKALGSFGAYVACTQQLKEYLINCCRGFIYTTALPPSIIGACEAAVDLLPTLQKERNLLAQRSQNLRTELQALGYETGDSTTQIIPVLIGPDMDTLNLSRKLLDAGYLAIAIRAPTVPPGQSRIRLSLTTLHTDEQIQGLLDIMSLKI